MNDYSDEEIKELNQKGLFDGASPNDKYVTVYKKYRTLLEKMLSDKLHIKSFDEDLDKSNLDFRKVNSNQRDIYQMSSTLDSSYVYLRNDLYLNRLPVEAIEKIESADIDNPSDEIINLVINTYKDVLYCGFDGYKSYGPDSDEYWKDSRSIVFGFRYDEFPEDISDDDFDNYNYSQIQFLSEYLDNKSKEYSKILGADVEFIWFNEFTIDNSRKELI